LWHAAGGVGCGGAARGCDRVVIAAPAALRRMVANQGQARRGEDHATAARREVEEETGIRCIPKSPFLEPV